MNKRTELYKNILKKIISLIIIHIVILLELFPIVANADATQYKKYVALGDSIAYGYGLENRDTESYSAIIKSKYSISDTNYANLAISGMTCAEFSEKIKTDEYSEIIKNADLITVSIGSNEILVLITEPLAEFAQTDKSDPAFMSKVQERFKTATLSEKISVLTTIYNFFTSESTKNQIDQAIETYKVKWKESVDYIKEINPRATIVATEFYNPYYEVNLLNYDFGGFCDESIDRLNTILHDQSDSETKYKIAEIYNSFNTTNPRLTNVDISITNLNLDPHPSKTGHEIISTKIMDKLIPVDEQRKKDIILLSISSVPDQEFTGEPIEPKVVIKDGNETLVEDVDYTLSYQNNIAIGQAKITIVGIGYYTGRVSKTFNIIQKNNDNGGGTGKNTNDSDNNNNNSGNITNSHNSDDNNNNSGNGNTTNTDGNNNNSGNGNTTNSNDPENTTSRRDINILEVDEIENQTYTGYLITPDISIKDGNYTLKKGTDYSLIYKNNLNVGTAELTITGIGNYMNTKTVEFSIIAKDISKVAVNNISDQKYTGKEIKPNIILYDGSSKLVQEKDYTLIFSDNINAGTAKVQIDGKGNYTGSLIKEFNIVENIQTQKKDIKELEISNIEDKIYTGKSITPEVRIKDGDKILTKNVDYIIAYSDNINKGKATVTIAGKGDYSGQVEREFNILAKNISNTYIRDIYDQTYSGKEIIPDIIVQNDSTRLEDNKDYEITIENNINVGTAKITINGKGNFEGTTYKTFNIVSKNISFISIQDIPDQEYNGKEIKPQIVINSGDVKLEEGKDYSIKYEDNIDKGTAKVIVEGVGNYKGSVTKTFSIVEKKSNNGNNNTNANSSNNQSNNSSNNINNNTNTNNSSNNQNSNSTSNNNNNNKNSTSSKILNTINSTNNGSTNTNSNNDNNSIANKPLPKAGARSPKMIIISAAIKIILLGVVGKTIKISGI